MNTWKPWILLEYLLILSVWDSRRREIPLIALIAGGVMDLILLGGGLIRGEIMTSDVLSALLGILPGLFLFVLAKLTKKAGEADGIALAIIGFAENYLIGLGTLCAASLFASLYAIALLMRKKANRRTELPFLPFLTAGYFVCGIWHFGSWSIS